MAVKDVIVVIFRNFVEHGTASDISAQQAARRVEGDQVRKVEGVENVWPQYNVDTQKYLIFGMKDVLLLLFSSSASLYCLFSAWVLFICN